MNLLDLLKRCLPIVKDKVLCIGPDDEGEAWAKDLHDLKAQIEEALASGR